MRFTRESLRKDLSRHARDPVAVALWIGIPLLVGGLITLAFGELFSTALMLLLVPVLIAITEDVRAGLRGPAFGIRASADR